MLVLLLFATIVAVRSDYVQTFGYASDDCTETWDMAIVGGIGECALDSATGRYMRVTCLNSTSQMVSFWDEPPCTDSPSETQTQEMPPDCFPNMDDSLPVRKLRSLCISGSYHRPETEPNIDYFLTQQFPIPSENCDADSVLFEGLVRQCIKNGTVATAFVPDETGSFIDKYDTDAATCPEGPRSKVERLPSGCFAEWGMAFNIIKGGSGGASPSPAPSQESSPSQIAVPTVSAAATPTITPSANPSVSNTATVTATNTMTASITTTRSPQSPSPSPVALQYIAVELELTGVTEAQISSAQPQVAALLLTLFSLDGTEASLTFTDIDDDSALRRLQGSAMTTIEANVYPGFVLPTIVTVHTAIVAAQTTLNNGETSPAIASAYTSLQQLFSLPDNSVSAQITSVRMAYNGYDTPSGSPLIHLAWLAVLVALLCVWCGYRRRYAAKRGYIPSPPEIDNAPSVELPAVQTH